MVAAMETFHLENVARRKVESNMCVDGRADIQFAERGQLLPMQIRMMARLFRWAKISPGWASHVLSARFILRNCWKVRAW
jgi:hypothetical protein